MFVPDMEEVRKGCRKLHNEDIRYMYLHCSELDDYEGRNGRVYSVHGEK